MRQYGCLNALQGTSAVSESPHFCLQISLAESLHPTQDGLVAQVLIITGEGRKDNLAFYCNDNTIKHEA